MTDFTAVNAGAMQQGISDLSAAHKQTTEILDKLEGELNQSLAQWDGAARSAYTTAQQKWDAAAAHMAQVINTMRATLGTITENYGNNERAQEGRWA